MKLNINSSLLHTPPRKPMNIFSSLSLSLLSLYVIFLFLMKQINVPSINLVVYFYYIYIDEPGKDFSFILHLTATCNKDLDDQLGPILHLLEDFLQHAHHPLQLLHGNSRSGSLLNISEAMKRSASCLASSSREFMLGRIRLTIALPFLVCCLSFQRQG